MNNNYKSATTAGLLGIFLGSVGAHDWYLGNKNKGIIHVCLAASGVVLMLVADIILPMSLSLWTLAKIAWLFTILNGLSAIVMFGNSVWGLVEGIIILSQGDAGLARKGYMVAPSMNYNAGMQQNMNNMQNMGTNNMGNMQNMNGGMNNNMNGNFGNGANMNNQNNTNMNNGGN